MVVVAATVSVDVRVVVVLRVAIVIIGVGRGRWDRRGAGGRRIRPGWAASTTAASRGGDVCVCRSSGCRHGGEQQQQQ